MPRSARLLAAVLLLLPLAPYPGAAQGRWTVQQVFGSAELRPESLPATRWMEGGNRFSFLRANPSGGTDLWAEDARSGERTRLVDGSTLVPAGASEPIPIDDYAWSPQGDKLLIMTDAQQVWRDATKGLFYVLDVASNRLTPVSKDPGWQQFAKFSPDATRVGFVRGNDLWVTDLRTGAEKRLTRDGTTDIINGTFDWVYEEELGLQDGWRWSPDGERIAFWRLDQTAVPTFYMIRDTDSVYSRTVPLRYPKAGEANSRVEIRVVEPATGKTVTMETGVDPDIYLARMEWAASPRELVIQRMNRHQNRIDVLLADAATGRSRALLAETDSAWVDVDDDLRWIRGGRQFVWSSERDGFNHLYLFNRDGSPVRQLTRGRWDVTDFVGVDERGGWVYFAATEDGPTQRQLYRVKLSGGAPEQISRAPGTHSVQMSPAFDFYLDVHSRAGVPPVTSLHTARGAAVRTLEANAELRSRLAGLGVRPTEFFSVPAADGTQLNGWMIKPRGFDPAKKYPVLMYVYGGPGSQTVTDAWGGNRFLWHELLADRGYIVASIDNRGTGARGRDFKKATYLNLGIKETDDQIAGARWLARQPYVDAGRIGIWGWSYGGYMTALTLARSEGVFKGGVSVAPVTDWRLYDNIYTERFMRTPRENPEGYRAGAPSQLAAGIDEQLLLIHGTGDDNVHFQNSVQLAEALQREGKQFDFMFYPNRTHSISGGNTQVHLFTLMTDWVTDHL